MARKNNEALVDLNKSLEIQPNDVWTLRIRESVYFMMEKYEESLADLSGSNQKRNLLDDEQI